MSDVQVPPAFWDQVARDLWQREPAVWERPFGEAWATEDDVFRALCALTARLDTGDVRTHPRLWIGGAQAGFSLDRHAARPEDGDLPGWERRLLAGAGERALGMVVGDAVSLDPRLWHRAVAFLRGLHAAVGMPAGGAHAEIFFGNYQSSFFGLHKDRLETFTFVVRGRKRFLLWPYEAWMDAAGARPGAPLHALRVPEPELTDRRSSARILEGGPGDVMFWPASWWHVAEAVDAECVTTLTLACPPATMQAAGSPLRLAAEGFDEAGSDGYYRLDPALPPLRAVTDAAAACDAVELALAGVLADPVFRRARRVAVLQWLSAAGFKQGPDRLELPVLAPEDTLEAIAWILCEDTDEHDLTCATNGILLATTRPFLPLIDHLNAGGRFTVGELVARFASEEATPSAEEVVEALMHLVAAHALRVGGA